MRKRTDSGPGGWGHSTTVEDGVRRRSAGAAERATPVTPTWEAIRGAADLLDLLPDGLLVCDALGRIEFANRPLRELAGLCPDEILGRPVEALVPERLRAAHERQRDDYQRAPRPRPMGTGIRTRLRRGDGTELPVEIDLRPVEIDGAQAVVASVRDVSSRREADEASLRRGDRPLDAGERERLALGLRDGAIHSLFAAGLGLQRLLLSAEDPGLASPLEHAMGELDAVIGELRDIAFGLQAPPPAAGTDAAG